MLARRSQKGSVIGYCSCGAAYPPGLNAGGTARLDTNGRELTGVAPEMIAYSLVCIGEGAEPFTRW